MAFRRIAIFLGDCVYLVEKLMFFVSFFFFRKNFSELCSLLTFTFWICSLRLARVERNIVFVTTEKINRLSNSILRILLISSFFLNYCFQLFKQRKELFRIRY